MNEDFSGDYVIRFDPDEIEYPQFCPACDAPATDFGVVLVPGPETEDLDGSGVKWDQITPFGFNFRGSPRHFLSAHDSLEELRIPTCKEHAYSPYQGGQRKCLLMIMNTFSIIFCFFFIISVLIELTFLQRLDVPLWLLAIFGTAVILFLISNQLLGPNDLMEVFEILGYDHSEEKLTVRIKNEAYAREILYQNSHAVLVENR